MTWLIVLVIAAVVMGAIGYFSSKDGERGENAAAGAVAGARLRLCDSSDIPIRVGNIPGSKIVRLAVRLVL